LKEKILNQFSVFALKTEKKKTNPEKWRKHSKNDYQRGVQQISSRGKLINSKKMKEPSNQKCIHKCNEKSLLRNAKSYHCFL
jgi:hypothetical protein